MPDLTRKSTATPPPPSPPDPPGMPPPSNDVKNWERFEGFRFTFLHHFPETEHREALQGVAQLLYDLALEHADQWEPNPGTPTRWELLAAMADLRVLEGYLRTVYSSHQVSSLGKEEEALSRFAGEVALSVHIAANRIAQELSRWPPVR